MNKKRAILIIMGVMAAVYLFLLVGIPALADMVGPCGSCNSTETADSRERYKAPLIIYFTPGLISIAAIVVILKQKKEVK